MTHKGFFRSWCGDVLVACLTIILSFPGTSFGKRFVLEIKPYVKIVGPYISLSDICTLKPKSEALQQKIALIKLGKAAPPSESKDLSLSYIKLQLRRAGLLEYIDALKGPRIIRVTTAHKDITRLRIEEAIVKDFECDSEHQSAIFNSDDGNGADLCKFAVIWKEKPEIDSIRTRTIRVAESVQNHQILKSAAPALFM